MHLPTYREVFGSPPERNAHSHAHAGLWFERFFSAYTQDWQLAKPETKQDKDPRCVWLDTFESEGDSDALNCAALDQLDLCDALSGTASVFQTTWRFVTGMGNPHPVENALAWHPTLGVPYLAGAAVKGLVRAWVEEWVFDESENAEKRQRLLRWFGSDHKDPRHRNDDAKAGAFIFFDALPVEPVHLLTDIMTPHMGKWYELGGGISNVAHEPEKVPADWHDPVPIPFLVVKDAAFLFSIAARPNPDKKAKANEKELVEVMEALKNALEWLGAGAKTAVGYGQMEMDTDVIEKLRTEQLQRKQEQEVQRKKQIEQQARQHEIESMDPLEREMAECEDKSPDAPEVALWHKLKKGHWSNKDAVVVAKRIKLLMQNAHKWHEKSCKKRPERDSNYQRTLRVLKYL